MDKSPLPISGLFLLNSVFYTFSCSVRHRVLHGCFPPDILHLLKCVSKATAQAAPHASSHPRCGVTGHSARQAMCSCLVLWGKQQLFFQLCAAGGEQCSIWCCGMRMKRRESLRQPWWVFWKPYSRRAAAEITQGVQLPWMQICCLLVCQSLQIGTSKKQHQHDVCAIWGGRGLTSQQNCRQRICSGDAGTAICNSLCACVQGTCHDGHVEIQKAHPCQILPQLMCLGPSLACCV